MLPETLGTVNWEDELFDASACSSLTDMMRLTETLEGLQSELRHLCELCGLFGRNRATFDACKRSLLRARSQHRSFRGSLEWECATRRRSGLMHRLVHAYVGRALQRQALDFAELAWSFHVGPPSEQVVQKAWTHSLVLQVECALLLQDVSGTPSDPGRASAASENGRSSVIG